MKVLFINTSEQQGGAAIAASRLLKALNEAGMEANMLVARKDSDSPHIHEISTPMRRKWAFVWERVVIWACNLFNRKHLFEVSIANTGCSVTQHPLFRTADIIHLHWINQGMLSLKGLQKILTSGKPVVWTLHDMWPLTGICHHAYNCNLFQSKCHHCPFLYLRGQHDLAYHTFCKKQILFAPAQLHIVAVSTWLASQAMQSTLLSNKSISVIPNTLSLEEFHLLDKIKCRHALKLPIQGHIILFGAARIDAPIKGFSLLLEAIWMLLTRRDFRKEELHLVMFGNIKQPTAVLPLIPINYTYMGTINDKALLSQLYSAADVTVSASHYETFGQTLIEAQACGCLPVSFGGSGQEDIIQHKGNGYLAKPGSAQSLADGIHWALTEGLQCIPRETLRLKLQNKYTGDAVAKQYIKLYQTLI